MTTRQTMEDLCKELARPNDLVQSKDPARSPDRQDHDEFVLRKKLAD